MMQITDGTSNTLCMMELLQPPQNHSNDSGDRRGRIWNNDGGTYQVSTRHQPNSQNPDYGFCINAPQQGWPCTRELNSGLTGTFFLISRSRHTGGVNVSLCDGSVRFITNSINLNTWTGMSSMAGGETLGEF
jgi:prepilin-type processing-associated H-X9-DG protein